MRKPSFTLEQWADIFKCIETLEEFAAFEEMFRTDCFVAGWQLHEWSPIVIIARAQYHQITRAVFK